MIPRIVIIAIFLDDFAVEMTARSSTIAQKALVPRPGMLAKVNESVDLLCKAPTGDTPLILCVWERNVTGQREVIIIGDEDNFQNGGHTSVEGITLAGDGFESGKCGVNILKVKADHFGRWSCTLVNQTGSIFTGEVSIIDGNQKSYCLEIVEELTFRCPCAPLQRRLPYENI